MSPLSYIHQLPIRFIIISLIIYIPLRFRVLNRKNQLFSLSKEFIYVLCIIYFESLLYVTVFPSTNLIIPEWVGINIVPFHTIGDYLFLFSNGYISTAIVNLVGNVIVFVPLGVLFTLLYRNMTFIKMFAIGFMSTLAIECTQLVLSIAGFLSRSFDVDDLILNTVGVISGYFIAKIGLTNIRPPTNR
ncbi:VanZ family protein [Virgibacillus sp. FSP13]